MACFERVSVFLTRENLLAQIRRHYTMQVKKSFINFIVKVIGYSTFLTSRQQMIVLKLLERFELSVESYQTISLIYVLVLVLPRFEIG